MSHKSTPGAPLFGEPIQAHPKKCPPSPDTAIQSLLSSILPSKTPNKMIMSDRAFYYFKHHEQGQAPEYLCVCPATNIVDTFDESRKRLTFIRFKVFVLCLSNFQLLYQEITREEYMEARILAISRFIPSRRRKQRLRAVA